MYPEAWGAPLPSDPSEEPGFSPFEAAYSGLMEMAAVPSGFGLAWDAATGDEEGMYESLQNIRDIKGTADFVASQTAESIGRAYDEEGFLSAASGVPAFVGEQSAVAGGAMAGPLAAAAAGSTFGTPIVGAVSFAAALFGQHLTNNLVRQMRVNSCILICNRVKICYMLL